MAQGDLLLQQSLFPWVGGGGGGGGGGGTIYGADHLKCDSTWLHLVQIV